MIVNLSSESYRIKWLRKENRLGERFAQSGCSRSALSAGALAAPLRPELASAPSDAGAVARVAVRNFCHIVPRSMSRGRKSHASIRLSLRSIRSILRPMLSRAWPRRSAIDLHCRQNALDRSVISPRRASMRSGRSSTRVKFEQRSSRTIWHSGTSPHESANSGSLRMAPIFSGISMARFAN